MNRHIIGLGTFLAAIIIGAFAGGVWWAETTRVDLQPAPVPPPTIVETISAPAVEDEFAPEFRDLPNFDELYPGEPVVLRPKERLIEYFENGVYRSSEVVARNGEEWFVLVKESDNFRLQKTRSSVKQLKTGSWPGDEFDAKLTFNVKGKPVMAFKNIRGLKPGPITTFVHQGVWDEATGDPPSNELTDGFRREFVVGQNTYILRTSSGLTKDGTKVAVLVLETNGVSQVLDHGYVIGSLLWAGDLDGDGRLDLYFDEYNEKGMVRTELHLSTYAESGDHVGLAATFGTAGC